MKKILFFLVVFSSISLFAQNDDEARLLRFPTTNGTDVVFSYAGDLYTVGINGGQARKLTTDIGYEMFAKFSPDGKTIAFSAQYDGNTEVYTMPANGGQPQRITYTAALTRDDVSDRMGPNNIVMDWRDDETIIYRSRKQTFNSFKGQLFLANINGGLSEELPLPCGGFCSYSPDAKKMAYNQIFREFRTWKYYQGGMADDISVYDFETKETVKICENVNQDIIPMWVGDNIYYLSDRDRVMNMFCYNTTTKETTKVTDYNDYDIKFPSYTGGDYIMFEQAGYIYKFDTKTNTATKISITINEDKTWARDEIKDASRNINSYAISPDAKRMTFSARGDVWSVPTENGITKNLTQSPGVHDRDVEWSPNGKFISYISDQSGSDEIFIIPQEGGEPVQLTKDGETYKYAPFWSPDSKYIIWSDKMNRLMMVNVDSKKVTEIDKMKDSEFRSYSFSADSKWITYSKSYPGNVSRVHIYNIAKKESHAVTDEWYDASSPEFSDDGKFLFFISARDFNPIYSWTEWNHAYNNMYRLYFISLTKDIANPFAPENDEVEIASDEDEDENEEAEEAEEKEMTIDFDGIQNRVEVMPGKAGYYWGIDVIGSSVYFHKREGNGSTEFVLYDLNSNEETALGAYGSHIISANKKKMMVSNHGKYHIINLPKSKISLDKSVSTNNMDVMVDYSKEWAQIYYESWRQMRDFFYDENMHGADWDKVKAKYDVLLPYVAHRKDLNYIIGEMIGELNCGHAYVNGGDAPKVDRVNVGLLGAKLEKDNSGYFVINEILQGENWVNGAVSPLTEIGVNVSEGEYIIMVNGVSTKDVEDIYSLLVNTAGKTVELSINSEAKEAGARNILVTPIADESKLYYYSWVQENIRKVNEATNGEVGYIHVPDMGPGGLNEFVKHFYPQLNKRALIIDDRGNGGGNVSPMIIERLNRELVMLKVSRNSNEVTTRPAQLLYGPKVLLIDQYSASDGDLFPYQFKTMEMGTVIGVRSWGGVVGIRGSHPFIDGGELRKPEFAHYSKDGSEFIIEGYGVDPHIVVVNDPAKEYEGEDQQLNKAIDVILEQLEEWPEELPQPPDYPVKN